ncbi:bifunctional diguanylate cyclase/phosphodiesterase [Aestuariibacter sp. AA17]|uniref:Bifunctional diguanylate cyclase/phosphodiesterase n=1 Tax=Fluctibacter corallii TaxID=2984329 RepID=A0ABT3A522_9ALTE|nr:bifunctional diguanylate cyclase/phosphodiesterase [Aestuariibacter sp. AA17]MCV2883769.1 bifunctional diguanylate cyclase/phosphodiesterase [Aestuariibacter sp. AA17]
MGDIHQSLVTIPNRYAFLDRIDEMVRQSDSLSLMLIDVVRFSDVGSSLGYRVGDIILLEIANRIRRIFGPDILLGRISGDIFGLVLSGRHADRQLRQYYNQLVDHFKSPITVDNHSFIADFNVGAVANEVRNHDTIKLFTRAEAALKQAKSNKYENLQILTFNESTHSGKALALKADLKRAFARDELEIYFQPKVDLSTLETYGAECLLRWNHPLDGVLFPGPLIEAAQSYNMMNELGYWTLEQAFISACRFRQQGMDMELSVNISPTQLYDLNFVPTLKRLSDEYAMPLDKFELELTEDVALSNSLMVKRQLFEVRALGMKVAIDDFGKGYSNLAYMRDLAIDTIKIDKTFVMGLEQNPVNLAIIKAAMLIGESLSCRVVAEGIETVKQMQMLRNTDVIQGQGYLFAKALPEKEFVAFSQSDICVGSSLAYQRRTV